MGKRTQFEELVLGKAYEVKNALANSDIFDVLEKSGQLDNVTQLKNVCAKVTIQLSDELDEVCGLLSISKRRFLEAALIEALKTARSIMNDEVDIFEHTIEGEVQ